MRIRSTVAKIAIPAVAVGLIVTGCSGTNGSGGSAVVGTTNDINPQDPASLQDGGNLRMDLSSFPATFNYLHVDGADADLAKVIDPVMPQAFTSDASGQMSVNHDFFTDVAMTNTNPQTVTYTINPKAVWSDGTPITWEDLQSEAAALSGRNKDFQVSSQSGFDRVEKVERGADDRQAIVTFAKPYSEWQGQFSPLYPKAVTADPQAFNDLDRNDLKVSAGPFVIQNLDRTQNRITLARNPKWWGATPRLANITFSVLDASALLPAIQNNEIDYAYMSGLANVTGARNTPGVLVRRTAEPSWNVLTFNGAPGSLLEDAKVRVAITKAIDRQTIVNQSQHGVVDHPTFLNNHVFVAGQKGYQDNAAPSTVFNPTEAAAELDAAGWKLNGDVREKDGRKLELRDVMYQQDQWVDTAKIIQQNLAAVGVKLDIQTVPGTGLWTEWVNPGNFDIVQHGWSGSTLPLASLPQIYYYDPNNWQGNHGHIGSPELNAAIDAALSELDPDKAIELGNKADKMIWEEGFSLPLNQASGNYAVRASLANIGAFGMAGVDWTKVGFVK
ncbi:ABC transporter family substrate-binding protein [Nocardia stercoris]|uniref:ABC transporter family substrate-binding protein n=1 Tax=Nocardia stercoris TaxID=2483361 RepID=A0A3M2LC84_9NOCA|nr:ABC transporter family substrate-binding protein [Nocardia stercoris]RMI34193.1 ABC transporter family substrate-binding protein [Nocardia stercoris]